MKSDPTGFTAPSSFSEMPYGLRRDGHSGTFAPLRKACIFRWSSCCRKSCGCDAWAQGTHFDVPVFLFQGENDVLTLTAHAQAYFGNIEAPLKHMELISSAGHFAMFLQPKLLLEKLLAYVRPLAYMQTPEMAHRA